MPFIEKGARRILFVHIPRTGGTTVEHWLRTLAPLRFFTYGIPPSMRITPQHLTRNDLVDIFGDGFFDYKFALVRNPFRRLESEYKLHALRGQKGFYGGFQKFSAWLETNLDAVGKNRHHADNHFRPQCDFLGDDVQVFRYEDGVAAAIEQVAKLNNLSGPAEEKALYNTDEFKEQIVWDTVSRQLVEEYYKRDLAYLDYPKGT